MQAVHEIHPTVPNDCSSFNDSDMAAFHFQSSVLLFSQDFLPCTGTFVPFLPPLAALFMLRHDAKGLWAAVT